MEILKDSLLNNSTTILRIKQQNSFNEAFLMARLNHDPNQNFEEWKVYKTNYDGEQKLRHLLLLIV